MCKSIYSKQTKTVRISEDKIDLIEKRYKQKGDTWDDAIGHLLKENRKLKQDVAELYLKTIE